MRSIKIQLPRTTGREGYQRQYYVLGKKNLCADCATDLPDRKQDRLEWTTLWDVYSDFKGV